MEKSTMKTMIPIRRLKSKQKIGKVKCQIAKFAMMRTSLHTQMRNFRVLIKTHRPTKTNYSNLKVCALSETCNKAAIQVWILTTHSKRLPWLNLCRDIWYHPQLKALGCLSQGNNHFSRHMRFTMILIRLMKIFQTATLKTKRVSRRGRN